MDEKLKGFLEILEDLHAQCRAQLADLAEDDLDWRPKVGMNSLAVLAAHIAGAERYWIGDVVMRESSNRDRDGEFATTGMSSESLLERLESALEYSRAAFAKLSTDQLDETRTSPRDGKTYSVAWAIAHTLDHTALHLGHIEITRQLLEGRRT